MQTTPPRASLVSLLLIVLLLPVMFLMIKSPFNFYDEGFALTGAQRVLDGQAPYRDFWGIYPPGQFYAIAAVFKLFGANVMAARVYDTLVRFAAALAAYLVMRKMANEWLARLGLLTVGLLLASAGFYAYAVFPALALGLWAVWAWLKGLESERPGWHIAAGAVLGLAALVRWDLGVYAAAGITLAGILFELRRKNGPTGRAAALVRAAARPAVTLAVMLAVAGLGYTAVGLRSGWETLFAQVFYFPAFLLRAQRVLAYPALLDFNLKLDGPWMQFYMPLVGIALVLSFYGYALIRRRSSLQNGDFAALGLAVFALGLFSQALSRYDFIHVTPSTVAVFLAACGLAGRTRALAASRAFQAAAWALLALYALMYLPMSARTLRETTHNFPAWGCFSKLEKAACIYVDPNQESAVQYIQMVTKPDEAIFVGNTRHDRVFVGDSGFYFLAARPVATRYHEIHPGVVNTLPVQEEIIAELEGPPVQWIVRVDIWESNEPNGSAVSTGVTALDEYLNEHYKYVTQAGWYQIEERRR